MKFLRKRWRLLLLSTVLLILVTATGLVYWAGSEIASPTRRGLQDFHREYLSNQTVLIIVFLFI